MTTKNKIIANFIEDMHTNYDDWYQDYYECKNNRGMSIKTYNGLFFIELEVDGVNVSLNPLQKIKIRKAMNKLVEIKTQNR